MKVNTDDRVVVIDRDLFDKMMLIVENENEYLSNTVSKHVRKFNSGIKSDRADELLARREVIKSGTHFISVCQKRPYSEDVVVEVYLSPYVDPEFHPVHVLGWQLHKTKLFVNLYGKRVSVHPSCLRDKSSLSESELNRPITPLSWVDGQLTAYGYRGVGLYNDFYI